MLLFIKVGVPLIALLLLVTFNIPPLLKIAPPPSSAAAPCAVFPVNVEPNMFIVPVPFHKAPPSSAAVLPEKVLPLTLIFAAPVMCKAPPFPGGPKATFPVKVDPVIVTKPGDLISIAPPALFVVLLVNEEFKILRVPLVVFPMAPPLLDIVLVAELLLKVQPLTVKFVVVTPIAPAPLAPFVELLLNAQFNINAFVTVDIPIAPPSTFAVAFKNEIASIRKELKFIAPSILLRPFPLPFNVVTPIPFPVIVTSSLIIICPVVKLIGTPLVTASKVITSGPGFALA